MRRRNSAMILQPRSYELRQRNDIKVCHIFPSEAEPRGPYQHLKAGVSKLFSFLLGGSIVNETTVKAYSSPERVEPEDTEAPAKPRCVKPRPIKRVDTSTQTLQEEQMEWITPGKKRLRDQNLESTTTVKKHKIWREPTEFRIPSRPKPSLQRRPPLPLPPTPESTPPTSIDKLFAREYQRCFKTSSFARLSTLRRSSSVTKLLSQSSSPQRKTVSTASTPVKHTEIEKNVNSVEIVSRQSPREEKKLEDSEVVEPTVEAACPESLEKRAEEKVEEMDISTPGKVLPATPPQGIPNPFMTPSSAPPIGGSNSSQDNPFLNTPSQMPVPNLFGLGVSSSAGIAELSSAAGGFSLGVMEKKPRKR